MLQIPPPPAALPEVVVTGARLPPAAGEAAFAVIRLDDRDLRGEQRLDEALASVPAVSLFRRTSSLAANPTTQGISLRAIAPSGAGRTLVTLDGAPLNDPFGGWVIWSQLPTESLSGLDIVRGAGAGPYGAGALTGVIQLRERDMGWTVDASVAERGGARLAASGATDFGPARIVASGLYETSDGYVPVRGSAAGAADTPLDLEVRSGALRADLPVGPATVSLRASAFEEERGSGLAGARSTASGNALSATAAARPTADYPGWRLQVWRRESDLANSSASVAGNRAATTPANDQYETPAVGWGVNAALRHVVVSGVARAEWELGADARFAEGETRERFLYVPALSVFTRDRIAGGKTSVAGLYAEGSWTSGPWLVAGGLRADHWENTDGHRREQVIETGLPTLDQTSPDRSGDVVSARLGVRRDIGNGQALRVAAYTGFRPATLNELHRPFRVGNDVTEANAALEPETLTGAEAGWSWTGDRASLTATAFWTRLDDAIVNVTLSETPTTVTRQRQNAGTIEAVGIELDGRLTLTDALTLRAALSVTDAEVDGGAAAPQLTGLRPAQAPRLSAVAGADWRATDRLTLAADLRWESDRFEDDLNSRVLEAGGTLDLRADWAVNDTATVWVSAANLFDEEIEVSETGTGVAGFAPPRTLSLGVRLSR